MIERIAIRAKVMFVCVVGWDLVKWISRYVAVGVIGLCVRLKRWHPCDIDYRKDEVTNGGG